MPLTGLLVDTAEARISELEDISIGTPKTEKQKERRLEEYKTEDLKTVGQIHRCDIHIIGIAEREERKKG